MRTYRLTIAVTALIAAFGAESQAGTITLSAVDSGSYQSTGFHDSLSANYIAGNSSNSSGPRVFRNWFVFDLSSVTDTIIGAELRLFNPTSGFASLLDTSETYSLFDVSTPISTLTATSGGGSGVAVYGDLGTGTIYGSRSLTSTSNNTLVSTTLNTSAIDSLNSATSLWAIGGANTTLRSPPASFEFMFGFTGSSSTRQLVLETQAVSAVPEPSSLALFSLGAIGVLGAARRRQSAPTNAARSKDPSTVTSFCE